MIIHRVNLKVIKAQLGRERIRLCREHFRELTIHSSLPEAGDRGSPVCQQGQWHCQNAPLFSLPCKAGLPAELRCASGGDRFSVNCLVLRSLFFHSPPFITPTPLCMTAKSALVGVKGGIQSRQQQIWPPCFPASYYRAKPFNQL